MKIVLEAGDVVYRVTEVDHHDQEEHTWRPQAIVVEQTSPRQIKLRTPFNGLARKVYAPDAYGRVFFATPRQAIRHFREVTTLEVEALKRRQHEAARALAWAGREESIAVDTTTKGREVLK